jgi:hypothetical protein
MEIQRDKVNLLIQEGKKKGLTGKDVIDALVRKGFTPEGVDVNAVKQTFTQEQPQTVEKPSTFERVKTGIEEKGAKIQEQIAGTGEYADQSAVERGVGATATAFSALSGTLYNSLPEGARNTLDKIGGGIGKGVEYIADKVSNNPALQEFAVSDSGKDTEKVLRVLTDLGVISGEILGADQVKKSLSKGAELVEKGAQKTASEVKALLPSEGVGETVSKTKDGIQLSIAKKNVNPQLESSTKRLFLDGTKNIDDPIKAYDSYLAQSKKALTDIKSDPAISVVGEKMGNAFQKVVKQRQAIGKVLGDELKTNGKVKVNVTVPKTELFTELKDSGLSYNPKTNSLTSFQGSKFAPDEVDMLDTFVKGVNALGSTPTVSQIDNFIAKTRSNLAFTKGKSGVIGTTNAERIINGGISKLRETLDPAVNGNTALSKYWQANKAYSELSDFVDEGSTFLGKKTLSGDFAKDASVAKSSVQSILNQGKKDFMVKLEALTGYKAIDDAVLALQAMKDAGDFRGLSLLQAMSETSIPTSKAGFVQKIIDSAMKKGGEIIAGTPEEQTRAFLQDLLKNENMASPTTTTPKTTPRTGAKTNSIKNNNKSVIAK